MRRPLPALAAGLLLAGLAACGPEPSPEETTPVETTPAETATEPAAETPTEPPSSVSVSDGGGDDREVGRPTETTEYAEQGEDPEGE